jgi:flagellar basal body-associated protein FliL
MEIQDLIIQIVVIVLGMIGGVAAILYKINKVGKKVVPYVGMVNATAENIVPILRSVGLDKLAEAVEEGGDVTEAVETLLSTLTTATEDGKIDTAEALALWKAGKGVWIEAKDFRVKIIPTKPQ